MTIDGQGELSDLEEQFGWAYHVCDTPLYQQVIDWFREKHNIWISYELQTDEFYGGKYGSKVVIRSVTIAPYKYKQIQAARAYMYFNNPYEALDEAILEALELI
jgi:hypothetical protein